MAKRGIVLAFLFLLACGSDPPPIQQADFEAAFKRASCEVETRCGYYTSVDACVGAQGFDIGQVMAGVAAGRIRFDADAARRCVDDMASRECVLVPRFHWPASCDAVFTGLAADGDACFVKQDCASQGCTGGACRADECCPGVCAPPVAEGATCTSAQRCPSGTTCRLTGQMSFELRCLAPFEEGATCQRRGDCAAAYFCSNTFGPGDEPLPGTCNRKAEHGAACDPFHGEDSCVRFDDYCDATSHVCSARKPPGAACETQAWSPIDSGGSSCQELAACVNQVCVVLGGPGAACTTTNDCAIGIDCVNGACVAYPDRLVCE